MDILQIRAAIIDRLQNESSQGLAEIARQVGMSQAGLRKIRQGERTDPRSSTVAKLASYYNLDCKESNHE